MVCQNLFFSNLNFDHLKQPFVFDLQDNILIKIVNHLQLHKTLTCTEALYVKNALEMSKNTPLISTGALLWRRGVVVLTNAKLHSTKPELRFCAVSNPARGVSDIRNL